ncbi:MAG TPA: hypothetical protein DEF42_12860 [Desulfosporosinus sp.]|nr:hypothetical protein [Desulfosporosinus sp.]
MLKIKRGVLGHVDNKERIELLIKEGMSFNYSNFSYMSVNGYPSALKSEYISWKVRVENIISSVFGKNSSIHEMYKKHEAVHVIGNGQDKFLQAHESIIGSLKASIEILAFQQEETGEEPYLEPNSKVFIVHGHDELLKTQLEIFVKEIGLEPIVLHRQADEGLTVIEKFEKHSDVGYAFILLTPDDVSYSKSEENKADDQRNIEYRARPNVIFEFGYFIGNLGRNRVCCIYKEGVSLPTDVSGIIYKKIVSKVEEEAFSIIKDLKASGYKINI